MNKKGFTLVEVIIAMAIMSIIMLAGYQLFRFSVNTWVTVEAESAVIRDARVAMTYMDKEVRQALRSTPGSAVETANSGSLVRIYQHKDENVPDSKDKIVSYRIVTIGGNTVFQRAIYEEGITPEIENWTTLFNNVTPDLEKGVEVPYFQLKGRSLHVQLRAYENAHKDRPITLRNVFTIRSMNPI